MDKASRGFAAKFGARREHSHSGGHTSMTVPELRRHWLKFGAKHLSMAQANTARQRWGSRT